MRFSLFTLVVAVAVLALSLRLNTLQRRTVRIPDMTGLKDVKHLVVTVDYDVGWPIWHARHRDSFAAHNAGLYLDQDRREQERLAEFELEDLSIFDIRQSGPLNFVPNAYRLVFNVCFATGLAILLAYLFRRIIASVR